MSIGLVGIIAGMLLLIILVFKGMSNIYAAPICAVLVILTNGLPALDTFLGVYLGSIANWMTVGFAFAILGAMFGKVYERTGAAEAVGEFVLGKLTSGKDVSQNKVILMSLIAVNLVGLLLTWTGVSGIVVVLSTIPIAFSIARAANIPRKFIPAMMMSSGASAAMAAPGSPSIGNLTASGILGTTSTAGLVPGLVSALLMVVLGIIFMYRVIVRSVEKGEIFTEIDEKRTVEEEAERKRPNFWITLLPLLVVFLIYAVFNLNITICLTAGIALAVILLSSCLSNPSIKGIFDMLNEGVTNGTTVFFQVSSLMGFAGVVQQTEAFQKVMKIFIGIEGNPLLVATIGVVIFVLFTTSPPAALQLGLPAYLPAIESGTLSATALHRTAVIATTTFESMPYCGAAIISMGAAGVSMREGYIYCFVTTVLIPLVCTFITTGLFMLFPGLA